MNSHTRRAKAQSIERSLARCTTSDYETVIEGCMLAGTHWFNIVLHEAGILPSDQGVAHAEFLTGTQRRKLAVLVPAALAAIDTIESLRTPHVRGDLPGGEEAAQRALECLGALRRLALQSASVVPSEG